MVNYASAFSQSESEKYFEWITILINKGYRKIANSFKKYSLLANENYSPFDGV